MTSPITSGGLSINNAVAAPVPAAPAVEISPVSGASAQNPAADSHPGISPRIYVDPLAGVITQYLNGSGEIQAQIPSTAVVAYLRAGLTPEGRSKPEGTEA
ncbi:MAG: hypothetical protein SFW62_04965 [Alphaproteobacteria bacterium]|nr:hypothetical protein [Alphaproteobacteria bacterium]